MEKISGRQLIFASTGFLAALVVFLLLVGRAPSETTTAWTLRNLWTGQEIVCDYLAGSLPIFTEPMTCRTQPIAAPLLKHFSRPAD